MIRGNRQKSSTYPGIELLCCGPTFSACYQVDFGSLLRTGSLPENTNNVESDDNRKSEVTQEECLDGFTRASGSTDWSDGDVELA